MKHISFAKIKSFSLRFEGKLELIYITNRLILLFSPSISQVDIIQQVINSISLLLEIDKGIQRGENILDLLP